MTTFARRRTLAALVLAGVLATSIATARPARSDPLPRWRPPVDAPISDPFRAPSTPYGPGNRGIEYATDSGAAVVAAAVGVVAFAGAVAGARYVAVEHAGALRSTVGPMADIDVAVGQRVQAGTRLGSAAAALLFTVRRDGVYIDPAPLLAGEFVGAHLVADRGVGATMMRAPTRETPPGSAAAWLAGAGPWWQRGYRR
ncbi:MAG: peptidoglycan DD-metalloendopeptidase family protein [Acidimicrobiales bacterium]